MGVQKYNSGQHAHILLIAEKISVERGSCAHWCLTTETLLAQNEGKSLEQMTLVEFDYFFISLVLNKQQIYTCLLNCYPPYFIPPQPRCFSYYIPVKYKISKPNVKKVYLRAGKLLLFQFQEAKAEKTSKYTSKITTGLYLFKISTKSRLFSSLSISSHFNVYFVLHIYCAFTIMRIKSTFSLFLCSKQSIFKNAVWMKVENWGKGWLNKCSKNALVNKWKALIDCRVSLQSNESDDSAQCQQDLQKYASKYHTYNQHFLLSFSIILKIKAYTDLFGHVKEPHS